MARQKMKSKDTVVDSELVYCFAKCEMITELEDFLNAGTNTANLQAVGDRLFDEGIYRAAKIFFAAIPNNSRMSSCHLRLGEFASAVETAKKANNPKTWKEVCAFS
jgi:clathrin heavy chain